MLTKCAFAIIIGELRNLALGRHTWQGSVYNIPDSHRAVDGNANSNYMPGFCTHSGYVSEQYWAVDLGQSYWITSLRITNRGDCCGNVQSVSEVQHIAR